MADVETWKNATRGTLFLLKRDRLGNEVHEMVAGGKSFSVTKDERQMNMDRAASGDLDVFQNGTLVPVRLLDGDEEAVEIAANPNLMGETEMKSLFKGHWRSFESKIQEIKNPLVLSRLLEMAEELDATVRQVGIVQDRLEEIAPKGYVERDSEVVSGPGGPPQPEHMTGNAMTPK